MKKIISSFIFSIMAVCACALPLGTAQAAIHHYSNHRLVADYYDPQVIRDMVSLSKRLSWKKVYVYDDSFDQGIPSELQEYANTYFAQNGIDLNYIAADIVEAPPSYSYEYYPNYYYDYFPFTFGYSGGYGGYDRGYYGRHHGGGGRHDGGGRHGGGGHHGGGGRGGHHGGR